LTKPKKFIGVQQVLLHLDNETKSIVKYLCEQSGTLVIGWNQVFKTTVDMRNLQNQKFMQMPLGELKERLKQLPPLIPLRRGEGKRIRYY
jgi:hypothetical protein